MDMLIDLSIHPASAICRGKDGGAGIAVTREILKRLSGEVKIFGSEMLIRLLTVPRIHHFSATYEVFSKSCSENTDLQEHQLVISHDQQLGDILSLRRPA